MTFLILDEDIDLAGITETSVMGDADVPELCPPILSMHHQPWLEGQGGGGGVR